MGANYSSEKNLGLIEDRLGQSTPTVASVAPIAAGESFDSGWKERGSYRRLIGLCASDKAGTLKIVHSVDGEVAHHTTSTAIVAGTSAAIDAKLLAPHYKVAFENTDDAPTAAFVLHVEATQNPA